MSDGESSPEQRTWAMLGHLSAFAAFVLPAFGNVIGPLIVWLVKKDSMPFAADQAKEALNFNITVSILAVVFVALVFLLIGIPLLVVLGISWLVLTIVGAIKANSGVAYRYPFCLRLVS
ncbi:MAG: DUF4870 domain-containing protein [Phycisphaerales bacterium]